MTYKSTLKLPQTVSKYLRSSSPGVQVYSPIGTTLKSHPVFQMAEHPTFVVCQGKQSDRVHQTDGNKDVSS